MRVPFNRPVLTGSEMDYMRAAIDNLHISGDGPFSKRVHALLESLTGRAQGAADDLVHARARDGGAAARASGRATK